MNHIEHAIDEIERVLNGNKSRDVEEAYLQNAIRSLKKQQAIISYSLPEEVQDLLTYWKESPDTDFDTIMEILVSYKTKSQPFTGSLQETVALKWIANNTEEFMGAWLSIEPVKDYQDNSQRVIAYRADKWHEDMGDVLWWDFPISEAPYSGTPLDDDFPEYKTHFTIIKLPDEVEPIPKWEVNVGDLVIRKGTHEAKVYFVEGIDDDGVLLVNGVKDEFYTDADDGAIGDETLGYFYENFRLLAKSENLEEE